jgi:phosphoserine phosphatase
MTKERAILFVDIDGTLVHGGSSVFLAHQLGHADTVLPADEAYAAGRSRNDEVARIDALGYAGHREDRVQALLERMPLIDGIVDLVSWSRSAGVVPILASLAWDCVGGHLASRFGFAGFC